MDWNVKLILTSGTVNRRCGYVETTEALYHKDVASFALWLASVRARGAILLNLLKR